MFTGTVDKYPDMVFIFSHAGGTMPFIYQRFTAYPILDQRMGLGRDIAKRVSKGVVPMLKSFYYDTAQAAHPMAMTPLSRLVGTTQILFGTDFPFRTSADHVKGLSECGFNEAELKAIYRDNALKLLPRLSSR
jgi:predicted TIM-barrel fold metal-dependent hydrolase